MARFETGGIELAQMGASGNPEILLELGLMYATGRSGEVDPVTAHKWFNLAVFRGSEAAKAHREELAAQMSKSQIAHALRAAREWITQH
ncbi:MAG: sel1 repeat family protein [Rhizobiaceae bacterium]|nr:sel1 repeat family protein [Rhizobiaceae bacterium]